MATYAANVHACKINAVLIRISPAMCSAALFVVFAALAAPFATISSIKKSTPIKVVRIRPGWRGESHGM